MKSYVLSWAGSGATMKLMKVALRREDDESRWPTGTPAPVYLVCPCGRKVPIRNEHGKPVNADEDGNTACECGQVFDGRGFLTGRKMKLRDIGYRQSGLDRIRYYQCDRCGTTYPCATGMTPTGHATEIRYTPGPMCNGKEIYNCLCESQV